MDLRPPLSAAHDAFGIPAVVTPPGSAAISTRVIWLSPGENLVPRGQDLRRRESQHILSIPMLSIPLRTQIDCDGPLGDLHSVTTWIVDAIQAVEDEEIRVVVVPADAQ